MLQCATERLVDSKFERTRTMGGQKEEDAYIMRSSTISRWVHCIQEHAPQGFNPHGTFVHPTTKCEIEIMLHTNCGFFFACSSVACFCKTHATQCSCHMCQPVFAKHDEPCEDDGDPTDCVTILFDNGGIYVFWLER